MSDSDERKATQRGRYLSQTTDLRLNEAKAIAWSEIGYSNGAIARQMDTSKSTVSGWKRRAMALYGLEIAHALLPGELESPPDFDRVDPSEYLSDLEPQERRVVWLEAVDKNRNKLPKEFVADVEESAMVVDERALKEAWK